jgi:ribosomal protein S18 acetylase RimI-like enzyme
MEVIMFEMRMIEASNQKQAICDHILHELPNWFGIEDSIKDYVLNVQTQIFYAAYTGDCPVGFVSLKVHNPFTAELYVLGILEDFHRKGIGKQLVNACESYCRRNQIEFLTVKTLDESRESKEYAQTRLFYQSMGFKPLEVFKSLWDEENPCLFMAKYLL